MIWIKLCFFLVELILAFFLRYVLKLASKMMFKFGQLTPANLPQNIRVPSSGMMSEYLMLYARI
ncbi:hypothetical protein B841_09510 [Corynebacterium maris DSM 45190]|uniref:Uncharacterized protein n=1 Tax=Corynebacterium maris DSM 45190 TaxID=1224163 RepID=S5T400_9CORY|nr:hypothetical protein B841_09510 [Corynebacterium maris DSM 45190]